MKGKKGNDALLRAMPFLEGLLRSLGWDLCVTYNEEQEIIVINGEVTGKINTFATSAKSSIFDIINQLDTILR